MKDSPMTMTQSEVADALRVSEKTVRKMSRNGDLPTPIRIGPSCIRYVRSEVMAALDRLRDKPQRTSRKGVRNGA